MKKIVITFIDLPYVLLLRRKVISKKYIMQLHFNKTPIKKHKNAHSFNQPFCINSQNQHLN